jgi:hypothetical protein
VNEDRRLARAYRLRDLGEDGCRRILESDGSAQDLADRIEKIDLLISLRQLGRRVLDLQRRLHELRDDGHQQIDVAVFGLRVHVARPDGQPDLFRRMDAGDEQRAEIGGHGLARLIGQHVRQLRVRAGAGDDRG